LGLLKYEKRYFVSPPYRTLSSAAISGGSAPPPQLTRMAVAIEDIDIIDINSKRGIFIGAKYSFVLDVGLAWFR